MSLTLISYGQTAIGKRRNENQDSFAIVSDRSCSISIVADGMGGVHGGAVASKLAIDVIASKLRNRAVTSESSVQKVVANANDAIYQKGLSDPQLSGMGTTVVGILHRSHHIFLFHVGDSRAYRIRDGAITRLTTDHTLVNELIESGTITESQAKTHPVSHMLTRSLGPSPSVECDVRDIQRELALGDEIILCSDGLYGMISDETIAEVVSRKNLSSEQKVETLIALANNAGGIDNITALHLVVTDAVEEQIDISDGSLWGKGIKGNRMFALFLVVASIAVILFLLVLQSRSPTEEKSEIPVAPVMTATIPSIPGAAAPTTEDPTVTPVPSTPTPQATPTSTRAPAPSPMVRVIPIEKSSERVLAMDQVSNEVERSLKLESVRSALNGKKSEQEPIARLRALAESVPELRHIALEIDAITKEYVELQQIAALQPNDKELKAKVAALAAERAGRMQRISIVTEEALKDLEKKLLAMQFIVTPSPAPTIEPTEVFSEPGVPVVSSTADSSVPAPTASRSMSAPDVAPPTTVAAPSVTPQQTLIPATATPIVIAVH